MQTNKKQQKRILLMAHSISSKNSTGKLCSEAALIRRASSHPHTTSAEVIESIDILIQCDYLKREEVHYQKGRPLVKLVPTKKGVQKVESWNAPI